MPRSDACRATGVSGALSVARITRPCTPLAIMVSMSAICLSGVLAGEKTQSICGYSSMARLAHQMTPAVQP